MAINVPIMTVRISEPVVSNHRTPLFDWHLAHKARMVPFGGWDMPVQYSGIIEEHNAVRTNAGLFDISHMARVNFDGAKADVMALLENVFTNSVASMKVGQVRYGLICNPAGGILDDVLVYRLNDRFSMVVNAGNREKIMLWLKRAVADAKLDVAIADTTESTSMVAIQGPKAVAMMTGKFPDDVNNLKYYYATQTRYKNQPCIVSRTGYTGEDGFEVIVPNELAQTIADEFVASGALPCGLGARDTLRLEAAMPLYGHELSESISPLDAGLNWAVKMDKGPFIGRDALAVATPMKTRVGLLLEGKRAAREGSPIVSGDSTIGIVTSGSYTPWLGQSIAMGYVSGQPTTVEIDLRGSRVPAKVVPLPFYKRQFTGTSK
jgi:aminomethyltransferase